MADTWFTDGSGFSSPTVSELQSREAARHQWQCNGTGLAGEAGTRAMSTDAMRETEPKKLHLLGNHRQVARCKSVCAAGEGIRRRWRGGRDRKLSTRVARFVLRPQNKAAKSGVFSLEAERRGDERNKKKQSKLKNLHRRSGSENFLTKTEMDSRYFFFSNQTSSAATAHQWSEGRDGA